MLAEHSEKIDFFVRTALPPVEGIFYDGQMLEPFGFINGLIRSAKTSIVLIDNYVDETILLRLAERARRCRHDIHPADLPVFPSGANTAQHSIPTHSGAFVYQLTRPFSDYRQRRVPHRSVA